MAGALSSIGVGSDGALSYDTIDQLKEADKSAIVDPIKNRIEKVQSQQTTLSTIKSMILDINKTIGDVVNTDSFGKIESNVSGSSVNVIEAEGLKEQNIRIDVTQLAQKSVFQSDSFAAENSAFSDSDETLSFTLGTAPDDKQYSIDITAGMSISQVAQKIEEETDGAIEASILNVGGENPYKLIIKSKETGADNEISIDSSVNFDNIQHAQDALFKYEGVDVTSKTNTISSLVDGLKFKLEDEGVSTISIKPDTSEVKTKIEEFVTQYNLLIDQIQESTKFDKDSKSAGVFQGTSEIISLKSDLQSMISTFTKDGKNISDFGLDIDRYGKMSLDSSKLDSVFKEDLESAQLFFQGTGDKKGLFGKLEDEIFDLSTSSDSPLKSLSSGLNTKIATLEDSYESAQKKLDTKYEIMAKKFASYDGLIGRLTAQFDSLQAIIDAENAQ